MAAITSANVTKVRKWEIKDAGGATVEVVADLVIALSAQGGTAGDIPASALGFNKIYSVVAQAAVISATLVGAVVCKDQTGTEIFPVDVTQATDANRANRANLTGDLYVRVTGSPA